MDKRKNISIKTESSVDKTMIGIVLGFIIIVCLGLFISPTGTKFVINGINFFITTKLGFIYVWIVLISIFLCLYVGMGRYGNIKLGDGKKEYSEFSWAAMMFCASMAAGFLYWGSIEWVYHYMDPPFGLESMSTEAAEYGAVLPLFHWGFSAWSVYLIPAVTFAFMHFNQKIEKFDVASACRPVLGERVDGYLGKAINIFFLFGILGGVGTALGIGSPLVSACLSNLLGWEDTPLLRFGVMILVTVIFTISAYKGLKKGIRILSNVNVVLMLGLIGYIFIFSDTSFILKMQATSVGILLNNFFKLSTYMDPINNSGHPESWIIFYWAWWMSYSIFMGLFIAKISKGRTVRQVVIGGLGYGFLGSFAFFSILGNFFMSEQLSGSFDVVKSVTEHGGPATVAQLYSRVPMGSIVVGVILITCIISMATNFDSAAYTMAMVSSRKIKLGGNPGRAITIFWAMCLAAIPMALMLFDGSLLELQTLSIILALPTCAVYIILVVSCFKMFNQHMEAIDNPIAIAKLTKDTPS